MDFKFTKAKTITSLLLALITGYVGAFHFSLIQCKYGCGIQWGQGLVVFIIIFLLIYSIWSLIQKKEPVTPISTNT
ncbi:hypothetical protein CL620_03150 [archaeon]|nr:hypothetical protein [archaeon]